jgi:hypothetical protein
MSLVSCIIGRNKTHNISDDRHCLYRCKTNYHTVKATTVSQKFNVSIKKKIV